MRFFAIFLIITLIVTSMPISIFAVESTPIEDSNAAVASGETEFGIIPKEELEEAIVLSEVTSRREENVKHFDIGNGMYQAVTYGTAVHRKDANGIWQDIDNRLLLDSENNIYSTSDGRTKAALSINTNDPLISLSENGYAISMTPITKSLSASSSAQIVNHKAKTFDNISGASIKDVAEISNSSSIKYTNAFVATDIEYVLEANDIKENIIVKSPQNSYEYSFELSVDNLVPVLKQTGDIVFLDDETFEEKYHIPAPFMYDSSGDLSYDVHYELNGEKGSYIVTVIADPEWVNADNRSFPVTIDPTVKKSVLFDTYINSSSAATNYGTSAELWISSGKITFLRCSMPSLPAGCSFYAANLYVYYYYYSYITDGGLTAGAYQVMNSWSETGLTWNIAQPNTTQYISLTRLSTGYMSGARGAYSSSPKTTSFDVTNAAASWYADSSTNHGIALKYESGTNASVILKSYEAGSDYRAYFVITYTEPQIVSGVYRIKNAQNELYLDTTGGGYTAGTEIQQWSCAESDTNRNQLFKITFVRTFGSTDQLNYYTIRPMTNNRMGLESSLSGTSRDVTIETMSTTDDWANLLYNHLWAISKSGSYYTIKNGRISDTSYLTAPSNTTNGETVFTSDSVTAYSKWILEPYTGEALEGLTFSKYTGTMAVGETFAFEANMYSSTIGENGPVTYSVTNTDGTPTDKATINGLGWVEAVKPGQIRVRATYEGAPWIWYRTVTITKIFQVECYNGDGLWDVPNSATSQYIECNETNQLERSVWIFENESGNYYTIRNYTTGYYIVNNSNQLAHLSRMSSVISDDMLWKLIRQDDGSYKIQSKSNSSYYVTEQNVSHATQDPDIILTNTNEGSRQKWFLTPKTFSVSINNYYDYSFQVRSDGTTGVNNATLLEINNRQRKLNDYLFSEYGIVVVNNTPSRMTSYADMCHGISNINSTTIEANCTHGTAICDGRQPLCNHILSGTGSCNSYCPSAFHHNNSLKIHYWYMYNLASPSAHINIMWTGHRNCNCDNAYVPWSSGTHITATLYNSTDTRYRDYTAFHEVGHSLGASGDTTCTSTSCVMAYSTSWSTYFTLLSNPNNNTFCDVCEMQIRKNVYNTY